MRRDKFLIKKRGKFYCGECGQQIRMPDEDSMDYRAPDFQAKIQGHGWYTQPCSIKVNSKFLEALDTRPLEKSSIDWSWLRRKMRNGFMEWSLWLQERKEKNDE